MPSHTHKVYGRIAKSGSAASLTLMAGTLLFDLPAMPVIAAATVAGLVSFGLFSKSKPAPTHPQPSIQLQSFKK